MDVSRLGLKNEALTWRMDPVTKLNISCSSEMAKGDCFQVEDLQPPSKHAYDMLFLASHETMTHHEALAGLLGEPKAISFFIDSSTIKAGIIEVLWLTSLYSFLIKPSLTWNCPIGFGHSGHLVIENHDVWQRNYQHKLRCSIVMQNFLEAILPYSQCLKHLQHLEALLFHRPIPISVGSIPMAYPYCQRAMGMEPFSLCQPMATRAQADVALCLLAHKLQDAQSSCHQKGVAEGTLRL